MSHLTYDVVIAGAGSGGIGAAIAATRTGLDVALLEARADIGGTAAQAGVSMWEPGVGGTGIPLDLYLFMKQIMSGSGAAHSMRPGVGIYSYGRHFCWPGGEQFPGGEHVIDPQRRYAETLRRYGARSLREDEAFCRTHWHGVVFEPHAYVQAVKRMLGASLTKSGRCTILCHAQVISVKMTGGHVHTVQLADGRSIAAGAFVDATGDGALCRLCGCAMLLGQESRTRFGEPSAPERSTQRLNGVTQIFRITPVAELSIEPLPPEVPETCWWAEQFPPVSVVSYPNGDRNVNMLPTMSGEAFQTLGRRARPELLRRMRAQWRFMQTMYPEFRQYRIVWIAPMPGVRESARVVGHYILTEHDLRAGIAAQSHPDIVALADHAMDVHGAGGGCGELAAPYGIPYRCLIPQGLDNVLVACRAASFSALAASSCRLSRTMLQLGQAAGTAVALARRLKVALPAVPPDRLRAALRAQHVQLEHPMPEALQKYIQDVDL